MVRYSAADAERLTPERGKPGDEREPWEIDRARILHTAAFRRLQRKTQVFAPAEGDFFRTRLTHSIEVSQIAKGIALRVGANPTLCEAASLAHDIGHPPFGHAGERILDECMADHGGFEGNAQNLRVLATLEVKSDDYPGLNLTRATLDAMLKYKRSHSEARPRGEDKFVYDADLPLVDWVCQGQRDERTSFECQIMDWSDDVAYSVHDVEDGMWAELITLERLLDPICRDAVAAAVPEARPTEIQDVIAELQRVLMVSGDRERKAARKTWSSWAIYELVHAATAEPDDASGRGPRYACRLAVEPGVQMKSRIRMAIAEELVFRHSRVASVQPRASRIVGGLFDALTAKPELIPEEYRTGSDTYRAACDYVSGMTDDYAERKFGKL
jgi:dGTPase